MARPWITLTGENEPPNDPNSDEEKTEDSNGVHGVHVDSEFPLTFPKHSPRETYGKMAPYVHPAPNCHADRISGQTDPKNG